MISATTVLLDPQIAIEDLRHAIDSRFELEESFVPNLFILKRRPAQAADPTTPALLQRQAG